MIFLGVNVAVLNDGKVLLTRREDFEIWCLPGGAVDEGESLGQAAVREVREETGLEVELERLVGIYSAPKWHRGGSHIVVFAARPAGGQLEPLASEVIEMGYFGPDEIPEPLLHGTRQRIADVFAGVGGGRVWSSDDIWPFKEGENRWDAYRLRDESGLSRQEFYLRHFGRDALGEAKLEVGDPSYDVPGAKCDK